MAEHPPRVRSVPGGGTAVAPGGVALVLGVASILLVQRQRADLIDQLDDSLQVEADRISDAAENDGALPEIDDDDERLVVVVGADGDVVARSGMNDANDASALVRSADDSDEVVFDDEPY